MFHECFDSFTSVSAVFLLETKVKKTEKYVSKAKIT